MSYRNCVTFIILATIALAQSPISGQEKAGLVWAYTVVDGKDEIKGQFRVVDKVVFKGDKRVGVVRPKSVNETELAITDFPKLNGTALLKRTEPKAAKWKGELTRKDGTKLPITVEVKDM